MKKGRPLLSPIYAKYFSDSLLSISDYLKSDYSTPVWDRPLPQIYFSSKKRTGNYLLGKIRSDKLLHSPSTLRN